jgi:hypothetical protein
MWRAGQRSYGEVEGGRAILPFVVTEGLEVEDLVLLSAAPEKVDDRPVDLGVAAPASLVGKRALVTEARRYQKRKR